ncbi:MAG: FKBP-type peptidyl-prolyl cis-trans isomerase [Muribaculaceae bacterium]|nr:FKBP-type peptidyl-prolyl cis-trans isomerase [Muribaculaceae bacterium]
MAAFAATAIIAPVMTACSSDKSKKAAADSAAQAESTVVNMVAAVRDAEEAQAGATASADNGDMPYDAAFFTNPDNKAATTTAGAGTYVQTASGLKYAIITEGNGPRPSATDVVTVNYAGRLTDMDGTEFDSSYKRGEPTSFPLNQVIAGWTEGLQLMPVGSVYEFYIPSDLAYGERGGGPIPPNAPLLFKVQLISIGSPNQ